jgi:GNAT superfamily N-acetyltransferase
VREAAVEMIVAKPIRLEVVVRAWPAGFDALRAEALAEGYRHIERLASDWVSGASRFDCDGEALFAAQQSGVLAGIGGLTIDPVLPDALRVRRFYVRPRFRRAGVGRQLAAMLLEQSARRGCPVTVNAGAASFAFWEALGFTPEFRDGHTHRLAAELS